MVNLTNATVYIFVFPILPGSEEKANAIWCSPDRLKAWEDHMLRGVEPQSDKACDTAALTKISMHAKKLGINVTPTLIFEDGVIKPGTLTLDLLEEHLTESSPNELRSVVHNLRERPLQMPRRNAFSSAETAASFRPGQAKNYCSASLTMPERSSSTALSAFCEAGEPTI